MKVLRPFWPTFSILLLVLAAAFIADLSFENFNWSLMDFLAMAVLILVAGFSLQGVAKKLKGRGRRYGLVVVSILFLLLWMEMAVGIFGSPLAGS